MTEKSKINQPVEETNLIFTPTTSIVWIRKLVVVVCMRWWWVTCNCHNIRSLSHGSNCQWQVILVTPLTQETAADNIHHQPAQLSLELQQDHSWWCRYKHWNTSNIVSCFSFHHLTSHLSAVFSSVTCPRPSLLIIQVRRDAKKSLF